MREANPVVLGIIQQGLWNWVDLSLVLVSIIASFLVLRIVRNPLSRAMLLLPTAIGLVRLVLTIWNVALIVYFF